MKKIDILKQELEDLIENNNPYDEILKKSQELDLIIVNEMKKINEKTVK